MTIQELAKHYQDTGEYLPEARELEEAYLESVMGCIEERYNDYFHSDMYEIDAYPMTLQNFIDIERGGWQAKHGFYRDFSRVKIFCNTCGKFIGCGPISYTARCSKCSFDKDND